MDKKKLTLLIILGSIVIVLGIVLAIVLPKLNEEVVVDPVEQYREATDGKTISSRTSGEVESMELHNANGVYTFLRNETTRDWYLKEEPEYILHQSSVNSLAQYTANIYGVEIIAETKDDLFSFGLLDPQITCLVKFVDGTTQNVMIGDEATVGDSYYVTTDVSDKIIRCMRSSLKPYFMNKHAFHDRPSLALEQLNLNFVQVEEGGEAKFTLEYKNESDNLTIYNWQVTYPFVTDCDSDVLENILSNMASLTISSTVNSGSDVDLSVYGLAKNQRTQVTFGYNTGEAKTFYYGNLTEDGEYRYLSVPDDDGIYTISADLLDFINISPASTAGRLLAPIFVYNVDRIIFDALDEYAEIDVTNTVMINEDGSDRIDSNGNLVYDQSYKLDGKDVQRAAAVAWYQSALYIKVHSVLPENAIAEGTEAVGYLKYELNDRVDSEEVLLEFVPYGYDYYALRINGVCYFSILKEDVQDIADNLVALRNGELDKDESKPYGVYGDDATEASAEPAA